MIDLKELEDKRKKLTKDLGLAQKQVWAIEWELTRVDKLLRQVSGYDKIGELK